MVLFEPVLGKPPPAVTTMASDATSLHSPLAVAVMVCVPGVEGAAIVMVTEPEPSVVPPPTVVPSMSSTTDDEGQNPLTVMSTDAPGAGVPLDDSTVGDPGG